MVKRYHPHAPCVMEEEKEGRWVRYEDYDTLQRQAQMLLDEVNTLSTFISELYEKRGEGASDPHRFQV